MQLSNSLSEREIVQKYNVLPYYQQYADVSADRFSAKRPKHGYEDNASPQSENIVFSWTVDKFSQNPVEMKQKQTDIQHVEIQPPNTKPKRSPKAKSTGSRSQSFASMTKPSDPGTKPEAIQKTTIEPKVIQQASISLPLSVEVKEEKIPAVKAKRDADKQSKVQEPKVQKPKVQKPKVEGVKAVKAPRAPRKPKFPKVEGNIITIDDLEELVEIYDQRKLKEVMRPRLKPRSKLEKLKLFRIKMAMNKVHSMYGNKNAFKKDLTTRQFKCSSAAPIDEFYAFDEYEKILWIEKKPRRKPSPRVKLTPSTETSSTETSSTATSK